MSSRRDFVDLSPYLAAAEAAPTTGAAESGLPESVVMFRPRREPAPGALDRPGYVVLHADPVVGGEVLVGRMPDGIAGGVAEWTRGVLTSVDGETVPAEGRG